MKYEVGKWYGWNGGACPVHPETFVETVSIGDGANIRMGGVKAGSISWSDNSSLPIIAFRVIKEHKEPREFLARWDGFSECWETCVNIKHGAVLFREVLE